MSWILVLVLVTHSGHTSMQTGFQNEASCRAASAEIARDIRSREDSNYRPARVVLSACVKNT